MPNSELELHIGSTSSPFRFWNRKK